MRRRKLKTVKHNAALVLNITYWAIYEPRRILSGVYVARASTTE